MVMVVGGAVVVAVSLFESFEVQHQGQLVLWIGRVVPIVIGIDPHRIGTTR